MFMSLLNVFLLYTETDICLSEPGLDTKCCTREMEQKYLAATRQDFISEYQVISGYLRDMLYDDSTNYRGATASFFSNTCTVFITSKYACIRINICIMSYISCFEYIECSHSPWVFCVFVGEYRRLLEKFKKHVNDVFRRPYRDKLPLRHREQAITKLFSQIQSFLDNEDVDVHVSFENFFNELFPSVYYYLSLNETAESDIPSAYGECLARIYPQINPRPFKDTASVLAHQLKKGLTITRTFLQALDESSQIVNATMFATMDTQCSVAMTRLQYCSRCQGHLDTRGCTGFCLNVMRGCLAPIIAVNNHWNTFMHSFLHLASTLSYSSQNLEQLLLGVIRQLHDAIEYATETVSKYHQQVQYCIITAAV